MEILINEPEYCKLNISCVATSEEISSKKEEVLSYFKKAPVKGFRSGKVPLDAIKFHYKKQIDESLKKALAEEAFHNTIFENNIKPYGMPQFSSISFLGNKFSCEFSLLKKPEFELKTYKGFEIPKPLKEHTIDELTEKLLQDIRLRHGTSIPFEENDFVEHRDNLIVNIEVYKNQEKVEDLSANGKLITVGQSNIFGFDDNLLGMKVGETREFALGTENEYKFIIELLMGSKVAPANLDDELAQKFGKENFNALREYVAGVASTRVEQDYKNKILQQISARLVEEHEFKVPEWLAIAEAQYLAASAKVNWDALNDEERISYLNLATSNTKLSLVLDKIREEEPETQLSDQEVLEMIKQSLAKNSGNPDEMIQEMSKNGYLSVLVARIRDEFTLDFIVKNITLIE